MSNPALELHELYATWRARIKEAKTTQTMTTHLSPSSPEGIAEIRRAYALLSAIEETLRRFELENRRVQPYKKQLDGWARVPLSLPAGWGSNVHPDHLVSQELLDQIESFGGYLEGKVLVMAPVQQATLREIVDQADILMNVEGFDPTLRQYLRRLIAAIRYALDDEQAGRAFDFEDAVEKLWVAFNAAAERAPEDQKAGWRDLLRQIFIGIVSGGAVQAGSIALGSIGA